MYQSVESSDNNNHQYATILVHDESFSTKLRVGTDCSGIEAPIQAFRNLGVPFKHVFSSEIDEYCIKSIKANYCPEVLYGDSKGPFPCGDITKRNHSTLPDIDLYICGFPCQPFSSIGKKAGFDDHRGNVFWSCLEVIKVKQPRYFILENVRGILYQDKQKKSDKYGKTWSSIWSSIESLVEYGYYVDWRVLNTKDYGIPQNRERVYIVGTKDGIFEWPSKVPMNKLEDYVDWSDIKNIKPSDKQQEYIEKYKDAIFVNFSYINYNNVPSKNYCSCILTTQPAWCVPCGRYSNIRELLSLQGFSTDFNQVVNLTQMRTQIGNSMSVNVIEKILIQFGLVKPITKTKKLRIGTDCSGIEAPVQALIQLGVPFEHVFSSEIDQYCVKSIKANYSPGILYGDITTRDHSTLPDIDLYVCGFPCQPFSSIGRRDGLNDYRGNVFWSCLEVIKAKQPRYFVLENVKGLLSDNKEKKSDKYGKTWSSIWSSIESLVEYGYYVDWSILNTRDYGIPQNRERVYIVGTKDGVFEWPSKIPMNKLEDYVDWNDRSSRPVAPRIQKCGLLNTVSPESIFIDFGHYKSKKFFSSQVCPCILAKNQLWNIPLSRFANTKELLMLQGFPTDFKQVVNKTCLGKQIGNSMSVNVVSAILVSLGIK